MSQSSERIAELISRGKKLEAIKLLRETTGVSLKRAKEEIDRLEAAMGANEPPSPSGTASPSRAVPARTVTKEVADLARQGKKIEAIKLHREQAGISLKEAKEQVEAVTGRNGTGCMPGVLLLMLASILAVISLAVMAAHGI